MNRQEEEEQDRDESATTTATATAALVTGTSTVTALGSLSLSSQTQREFISSGTRPPPQSRQTSTSSLTSELTSDPSLNINLLNMNINTINIHKNHMNYNNNNMNNMNNTNNSNTNTATNIHHHGNNNNNGNNMMTETVIYDCARITDWRRVQSLATSQPHHASYTCTDGLTALHHACTRRCPHPSVFSSLIQAHPEALIKKDLTKGWTPLHHACRFKCNKDGISLLLNSVPEYGRYAARVRDKERGRTPLYYAIRYDAPEGVVELLLANMNCEDILDCDRDGMSVLGLVWDRWVMSFEGKRNMGYYVKIVEQWKSLYLEACGDGNGGTFDEEQKEIAWNTICEDAVKLRDGLKGKLKANWDKVDMILRGAFKFDSVTSSDGDFDGDSTGAVADADGDGSTHVDTNSNVNAQRRKWRIFHAAVAIKCHPSLFMMAAVLHPEQIRELDCGDLFADDEHEQHAGTKTNTSTTTTNNARTTTLSSPARRPQNTLEQFSHPTTTIQSALHLAAKSPTTGSESKVILKHLLLFYPEATKLKNPKDGSLPLHHLCENESKQHWVHDGIRSVYEAYKDAAVDQDLDGRTPLHRAATLHESSLFFVPPPSTFIGNGNTNGNGSPIRSSSSSSSSSRNVMMAEDSTGAIVPNTPVRSSSATASGTGTRSSSSTERNSNDTRIASVEDPVGSIIQNILTAHPEVAAIPDVTGKLLMHSIAECAENWDCNVQAVYDAYPEALSRREIVSRSLPLHLVASNLDAKPRLVQKIVEYHPRAASLSNGDGRLPLHLACESGKTWYGGTEDIYNAFTRAIQLAEEKGRRWMPLHFAASSPYSSLEFIDKIIGLAPGVAHVSDRMGCTPFYLAVESGKDWEEGGLEILFQANPDAIDFPDSQGKIPLVAALLAFCSDDGIAISTNTGGSTSASPDVDHANATLRQESLQSVDEYTTITHTSISVAEGRQCDPFESDLAQINVLYHLLKAAPHVLTPRGY
mmetsp:Transcript_16163/g.24161  ORF Transcript_16163/g.24161 Transcript_16163/m.24161 type:complete len:982 (-) Transcript_16163:31-2976(-)